MKFIITEEQSEKLSQKVKSMVEKYGFDHTLTMFDDNSEIIKRAYQDNPSEFLNQFNNLKPVERGHIYYVDKDGFPLFQILNMENRFIYINNKRIWWFFSEVIGLEDEEIRNIIKKWLREVYGITGFKPLLLNMTVPII